jgi:ParB family transcriptional regulator, chromosome partitioning protein
MSAKKTATKQPARKPGLYRSLSAADLAKRDAAALSLQEQATARPLDGLAAIKAAGLSSEPVDAASASEALLIAEQRIVPGMTAEIPLHLLREGPFNARVFYRSAEIDEMVNSLERHGQEVSAEGWIEDQLVWLIDGGKRYRASRAGGRASLRVELKPKPQSNQALYLASRRMNTERSTQTAIDDAVRFRALLDDGVFVSQDAIAEAVGLKKAMVSTVLSLTRIPERLLGRMKESDVTAGVGVAAQIARLFIDRSADDSESSAGASRTLDPADPADAAILEDRELVASEIIDETIRKELTRTDVQRLVRSRIKGPQQRQRADVRELRWGSLRGQLKVTPKKRAIEIALPEADLGEFEALVARLESILAAGA